MQLYYYNIKLLFKRLLLALSLFFLARLFFYIYNIGLFLNIGLLQLIKIFAIGIRFDLSAIMYFNLIFILVHILPFSKKVSTKPVQLFLKIYFVAVNGILLFTNLTDSVFFHFVQKRSTSDIFKFIFLSNDVKTLIPGFLYDYWFVPIISIVVIALLWMIYPKINYSKVTSIADGGKTKKSWLQWLGSSVAMLVLTALTLIAARGGLQLKPIAIIDASKQVSVVEMPLVLNSVFTLMTTYGHAELHQKHYFSEEKAEEIFPVQHAPYNTKGATNKKNIVVLLLESFSREYVGSLSDYKGFTPFLDSLMQNSLVFENAFSNGLRSIDAIPAIVIGLPALMDDPFITSIYSSNKTNSLPKMLKKKGYHSSFFHGGTNGTMNFDGFASYAGFDDYYGRFEYNNDNDYDGYWGIYDEPFLQYFAHTLNSFKQPFFAFEFTLSSHYPYSIPDEHKGEFPEGSMKIHKVIKYADYSLKQFFNTAKKMPWYNNTLFILVADHPAQSVIPSLKSEIKEKGDKLNNYYLNYYKNTSGRYAIPIIFFNPGDNSFVGTYSKTVQQTDIFSSILNYVNYDEPSVSFGTSIFNKDRQHFALQYVNGYYQITSGNYSLLFDGDISTSLYDNVADPLHTNNLLTTYPAIADSLEQSVKAVLQQYETRMINNKLTVDK